ncbi:MAG: isopentenyl phosphate kinase family protein [Chloroflexi bacterium]|nr:isopentenyl phosphate kinase family protein [Chloroflexota bacterium]
MNELVLLKLGGSLITDKTRPYMARHDMLADLAAQIAAVRARGSGMRLILGHGSGSFGHTAAKEYGTREGVHGAEDWKGFAEVHYQAAQLNHFVMDALHGAGISALAFPPSGTVIASDGKVSAWETTPIRMALANGILPVVYGDVAFDEVRGGTILSTEDLFQHLARQLHPERILLAGLEAGVWADFPARTRLLNGINPRSYAELRASVGASHGADVTGGMESKVGLMLELVQEIDGLEALIFSAEEPGNLARALIGDAPGTKISA